MQNHINEKEILSVFDKIREHGKYADDAYQLEGVKAFTDFDGYTIFIEDALVQLRFGFHNQYHFDYNKEADRLAFEKKLSNILRNY